nr:MAG TPA: hypothetical protein [Caudoviricetes sp.]
MKNHLRKWILLQRLLYRVKLILVQFCHLQ